jgi:hypothetical protein
MGLREATDRREGRQEAPTLAPVIVPWLNLDVARQD